MATGADKQAQTEPVAGTIFLSSTVQRLRLPFTKTRLSGRRVSQVPVGSTSRLMGYSD